MCLGDAYEQDPTCSRLSLHPGHLLSTLSPLATQDPCVGRDPAGLSIRGSPPSNLGNQTAGALS